MIPTLVAVMAAVSVPLTGQEGHRFTFERRAMGTRFAIVLYASDSTAAAAGAERAFDRIAELDRRLSDYDPGSELSQLSLRAGGGSSQPVSEAVWQVLTAAQTWARRTDGAFDVTVGPLSRWWRWAARRGTLPPPDRLEEAMYAVGFGLLDVHPHRREVTLRRHGMRLDVGGIAKGYAADVALAELRRAGFPLALVDAGGDIATGDAPPGAGGWRVELPAVDHAGHVIATIRTMSNRAVATSGDTHRFVEIDGRRYSHVIDPRTGTAVTVRKIVTVIASTATDADAFASALTVVDAADAQRLVERWPSMTVQILQRDAGRGWATIEPPPSVHFPLPDSLFPARAAPARAQGSP